MDMGSIPDWYEIRFRVRFGEQKEIVPMDATHRDDGEVGKSAEALVEQMKQNAALRIQRWWRGKKQEESERRHQKEKSLLWSCKPLGGVFRPGGTSLPRRS